MGIFSRMKKGIRSKANAAVDKMIDPEKELDMAIMELDEQRKSAIKELISYKATAKQMEMDMQRYQEQADAWEKRAMDAVKNDDDDLAREALAKKRECEAQVASIRRDRDEAAGYAIELNRSRKKADTKLKILKLKKGTMAQQIAAARAGADGPFGNTGELFEKFERAEEQIDSEVIQAEVDAAMQGEEMDGAPLSPSATPTADRLLAKGSPADADSALVLLKSKMDADKKTRKLTE